MFLLQMSSNFGYQHIMQMQIQSPALKNEKQPYDELQQQIEPEAVGNQPLKRQNQLSSTQPRYKSFREILMIILNISLSAFYFGYTLAYLSSVDFDTVMKVYKIQVKKQIAEGILIGCIPIGGGIGALSSGLLIRRFSRRQCLMIVNGIAFLTGIFIFLPHYQTLLFSRLVQGICAGLFSSLVPLIMKQLSPTEISGTLTSCNQIFIAFGIFFAFLFSEIVQSMFKDPASEKTWWIVFGFSLVILLTQTFILRFVYNFETPKYLYLKNRDESGKLLIQRIYKPEYVDSVVKQIKQNMGRGETNIKEDISPNGNKLQVESQTKSLETPRSAIIVAIHLAALQQFCGINVVMAYGGQIVGQIAPSMKLILPILINLQQVIASIFTSYLLTRMGRKTFFQYGCVGASVSCTLIALGFMLKSQIEGLSLACITFGLVIFMGNFGLTLGPVVWVYLPQIVQPQVLPYAIAVNWGTAALVMLLFPVIKQSLPNKNPALLFIFFGFWSALSLFFNRKYLIQTKSKTQKQIFEQYKSKPSFC